MCLLVRRGDTKDEIKLELETTVGIFHTYKRRHRTLISTTTQNLRTDFEVANLFFSRARGEWCEDLTLMELD